MTRGGGSCGPGGSPGLGFRRTVRAALLAAARRHRAYLFIHVKFRMLKEKHVTYGNNIEIM